MTWAAHLSVDTDRVIAPGGPRIVTMDRPGLESAIVLSQTRGGSRADRPGCAGMAHLTEHLLAQSLDPTGRRYAATVTDAGGDIGGATHLDYLEFRADVPYPGLAAALRAERARLEAWPVLAPEAFVDQQAGVCQEIEAHRRGPTGPLPWPALGPLVFPTSTADSHDPFGEPAEVRALTEADCRVFYDRHYRPSQSVIVVLADMSRVDGGADAVEAAVAPRRAGSPRGRDDAGPCEPGQTNPTLPGVRGRCAPTMQDLEDWSGPGSVAAVGWRVPSVVEDAAGYAALMAVAEYLAQHTGGRARVGQMLSMDRADTDVLTLVLHDPVDARPRLDRGLAQLGHWSGTGHDRDGVRDAIAATRMRIAAQLDRPLGVAQLVGRSIVLAADPSAAGHWVERVRTLDEEQVLDAAQALALRTPVGVLGRAGSAAKPPSRESPTDAGTTGRTRTPGAAEASAGRHRTGDRPWSPTVVRQGRGLLTAAVAARLRPGTSAAAVDQLRMRGYRLEPDQAGWVIDRRMLGRADRLEAQFRTDLAEVAALAKGRDGAGAGVGLEHYVVVGDGAKDSEVGRQPTVARDLDARRLRKRRGHTAGVALRSRDGSLQTGPTGASIASAQLSWDLPAEGFIERWVALAMLMEIDRPDQNGDIHPLNPPPGTYIALRQEVRSGGPVLIADLYATPENMPDVLLHLADRLSRPRFARRVGSAAMVREMVAASWQREATDSVTRARRARNVLDLGGTANDVQQFARRVRGVCDVAILDQLCADTASVPSGWIETPDPRALSRCPLPWDIAGLEQEEGMTAVISAGGR